MLHKVVQNILPNKCLNATLANEYNKCCSMNYVAPKSKREGFLQILSQRMNHCGK